jgi:ketosteroid isomerase-like protein
MATASTTQLERNTATPERVLEAIVSGINSRDLESLMPLYESEAAFAAQPGSLARGPAGVREALTGFISMEGKLDLQVTRVLEVDDLALVIGVWSFDGTGPDGEPVHLEAQNADVLRRQPDGSWRFVIDNPWGTA